MTAAARPPMVDAHCHFDLYPVPATVLREAEQERIYSIAVTNTPSVFDAMDRLASGLKYVRPALGLHPELALERAVEMALFPRLLERTRYVGEVGLDYKAAVKPSDRQKQRGLFETILQHCARAGGRILTIHSRRAEADVLAALKEHRPGVFILHWYSGSLKTLRAALEAGAFFSVNSAMTMSDRGQRIIREIPPERVLTESDGPFVTARGHASSPLEVRSVLKDLARLWQLDPEETREIVFMAFESAIRAGEGLAEKRGTRG